MSQFWIPLQWCIVGGQLVISQLCSTWVSWISECVSNGWTVWQLVRLWTSFEEYTNYHCSYCIGGSGDETTSIVPSVTKNFSGVGTNFVLRGLRCIGRGGPKQHYIIMSNKINKDRIHTWKFYIVQHTVGSNLNCFQPKIWSPSAWYSIIHGAWLLEGGGGAGPPCWIVANLATLYMSLIAEIRLRI